MIDKFIADELAALRRTIERAVDYAERRDAAAQQSMQRLLDDRERARSEMIKVRRVVESENKENIALLVDGKVFVRAGDLVPADGQPGLYLRGEWPDRKLVCDTDEGTLHVSRRAIAATDEELPILGETYLVRVRITSRDPDCWDWHEWRKL